MKRIVFGIFLLLCFASADAANWYVLKKGSDAANGHTLQSAFRTLQKAADVAMPGDIIWIGGGKYESKPPGEGAVLSINRSGESTAWITWKALPGQKPILRPKGWGGIQIAASYQILDGLTILGNNDSIVLTDALDDAKKPNASGYFNTNGIFINGRNNAADKKPHHIIIRNCTVSKCSGGGITAIQSDYITVEDCRVADNGWFMRYAGSGITTVLNWAHDDRPGYHIIIQRNYVWNNKTQVPWGQTGKLSDGNGILLDVSNAEQSGPANPNADATIHAEANTAQLTDQRPEWKGRALIANNVSAYNGGSGIHTFRTSHVDIINNTTYWNGQIVGYPELFANNSKDIVILNNVIVPRPGGKVTSDNKNTDVHWDYNLYPQPQEYFKAANDIIADPEFLNIQPDPTVGDFSLKPGSKAIKSATTADFQALDIRHHKRPLHGIDRGAFQH